MRVLLDTHLLLWAAGFPGRLPAEARAIIEDRTNDLLFSVASIWEVTIKNAQGRSDFRVDPRHLRHALLQVGYQELAIGGLHVTATDSLPPLHKDPFDRVLIAQALVEDVTLLTSDPVVGQYLGPVRLVG